MKRINKKEKTDTYKDQFNIIISNGHTDYKFPLDISSNNSITDVAKAFYNAIDIPLPEGKIVKRYNDKPPVRAINKTEPTGKILTEKIIIENDHLFDWDYISIKINIPDFSDEFFIKFKSKINWDNMADYNKSMTTGFAHKYEKEIGSKRWYKDGVLHRDDGPAVIYTNKYERWYKEGKTHRDGGPAIIRPNGYKAWYQNGECHREDGPAIISPNGYEYWYQNGKIIK